jgi:hypothetical protein
MHHLVESECEARMAQLSYIHTNWLFINFK